MSAFTIPASAYPLFPSLSGRSWPITRTPTWKNLRKESASQVSSVAGLSAYPKWIWELKYEVLRSAIGYAELQSLLGIFNATKGGVTPFNYLDAEDNTAIAQLFGTGDGVSTQFLLYRSYGGNYEPIVAPYGTAKVFIDGVEKTATTDFTISALGVVTFATPPAYGKALTWTGTYYWTCRFTEDDSTFSNDFYQIWSNGKITFESLKPGSLGIAL